MSLAQALAIAAAALITALGPARTACLLDSAQAHVVAVMDAGTCDVGAALRSGAALLVVSAPPDATIHTSARL